MNVEEKKRKRKTGKEVIWSDWAYNEDWWDVCRKYEMSNGDLGHEWLK